MNSDSRTLMALAGVSGLFLLAALGMSIGDRAPLPSPALIAPVDPKFAQPDTFRRSYAQLIRAKADLSDFDCYACHEKGKPPPLRFDANHNLLIPTEHSDIVMGHGSHNRNNLCFNCHDEQNLELLQARDGRQIKLAESPALCGSCHGPTYRDWEAGAHGRTSGFWNRAAGPIDRLFCVDCHNPHKPKIPPRQPAPGPHLLHPPAVAVSAAVAHESAPPSGAVTATNPAVGSIPENSAAKAEGRP